MHLCEMNPFVRFAAHVSHGITPSQVKVTDCRIFYVQEGECRIHIDGKCLCLKKDSLFYCRGGSIYIVEATPGLQLICLNFDLDHSHQQDTLPFPVCARQELWEKMPVHYQSVEDSTFLDSYLLVQDAVWIHSDILELVKEYKENPPIGKTLCESLLKTLLLRLHQAKRQEMPEKLAQVQAYIHSHYKENLTNRDLGALVGYHEYYLNRTFLAFTGMNLHEYLIKVRMEQAAHLILNTDLSLNTIAEEVGIRSYPHFSGCFKATHGCSPSQYRKRHRDGI